METNKEVIIFICNYGFGTDAMIEARKAGASGGTLIHGRSSLEQGKQSFFGITINPEKDLLMIVCLEDIRANIMKAINAAYGPSTDAHGICFSMKVTDTLGMNFEAKPFLQESK